MSAVSLVVFCWGLICLLSLSLSPQLNHLRCLQDFAEAQATYYAQCHHYMQDLQRELHK